MNNQQREAARMLLDLTCLNGHPHILRCIESDTLTVDWGTLPEWNWSSGERVLVELLRVCLLGHGQVTVADIYTLDSDHQQAAAMAVARLFRADNMGVWE